MVGENWQIQNNLQKSFYLSKFTRLMICTISITTLATTSARTISLHIVMIQSGSCEGSINW